MYLLMIILRKGNDFNLKSETRMVTLLDNEINNHNARMRLKVANTDEFKPIPAEMRRRLSVGLLRVQRAQECIRHGTIVNSFRQCGLCPFNPLLIMSKCTQTVSALQSDLILQALPVLSGIVAENGELSDADMDRLHIPKSRLLDHLVVYRRRSIMLTHPVFVAKESTVELQKALGKSKAVVSSNNRKGR